MRDMSIIHISRMHFPVTQLGPGRRIGIWTQGCSIRCAGCISVDTWKAGRGATTVAEVVQQIKQWLPGADGFTISGGEPFDQPDALVALLRAIRKLSTADILVFSGYPLESIQHHLAGHCDLIDALITDPFEMSTPQTLALRGSDNQRLHYLTEVGAIKFKPYQRAIDRREYVFDLAQDPDGAVWLAGIPSRGDFQRLKDLLEAQGHAVATSIDAAIQDGIGRKAQ